ncbi:MAG: hypothetical protein WA172_11995 [Terriglobales bacterium]
MSPDSGLSRLHIPVQQPWFAIITRGQRAILSSTIAAAVFLSGGLLDWFVTREYLPRISLMLAGAAISLSVGFLIFQILTNIQRRYQMMLDQLRRVAELNHHIRNALQVIAYHNVPDRSEGAIQQVNTQIVRIQTALRGVSVALGDDHDSPTLTVVPEERRFGS